MNESNVTNSEIKKAKNIRKQYISHEENKMEQLKELDNKVKAPGRIVASVLGVVGSLTMGAGMAFVMVWENMRYGLLLGIPGLIVLLLAYPVYGVITASRKKKYADEIFKISDDVLNN